MFKGSIIGSLVTAAFSVAACASDQYKPQKPDLAADVSPWPDECSALPGFVDFRRELERVVTTRDTAAFATLLHPRLLPKEEDAAVGSDLYYSWIFGRMGPETVWAELEQVLRLGCVRDGEGVLLPAMAKLIYDMSVDTEFDMAIVELPVLWKPDPSAAALRTLKQGELVRTIKHGPEGWIVVLINDQQGFVRQTGLRSPSQFLLELRKLNDRWYIHYFGSGV